MHGMNEEERLYLVLVEADRIQSYIFQTGKLTENIGASAFIDEYNRVTAIKTLLTTECNGNIGEEFGFINDKSIFSDKSLDYELIYSGGGNVKVILRSHKDAERVAKKLVRLYRESTISADATCVVHAFDPTKRFDSVMREAEMKMRTKKLSKGVIVQSITIPYLKLCQSCGMGGAELSKEGDQEEYLCQSCIEKRKKGKENNIFESFRHLLSQNVNPTFESDEFKSKLSSSNGTKFDPDDFLPREFDHLTDPRNFIAVVVIDGNQFGKKIQKSIKGMKLQEATKKLREFSLMVDTLAEESLADAVGDAFETDISSISVESFQKRFIKLRYLFNWDDVLGNDGDIARFRRILVDDLNIDWAKSAKISKSDDGKTISILKDGGTAEIILDERGEKVTLKINDVTCRLTAKKENGKLNIYQKQFFIPFRPIIIGGDDLTFVCAADRAFEIALNFAQNLRKRSAQKNSPFGEQGLSCSVGIAIVKAHFPFRSAYHLAEELLAKAKQKNREYLDNARDFSTIDFTVVTTSSVGELSSIRERELLYPLNGEKYYLTGRPYIIEDGACPLSDEERRDEVFTLIKNAKKLWGCLAANKFKSLREIMRTGKSNSEYGWLELASRLIDPKRRKLRYIENFYGGLWRDGSYAGMYDVKITNFADMVEIYEYLGNLIVEEDGADGENSR